MFAAVLQVDLAAFEPPLITRLILLAPLVSSEVRMFSIDCAVKEQFTHVLKKALDARVPVLSNRFAGNVVNDVQMFHADFNVVALEKSRAGNETKPLHPIQHPSKSVPFEVLIKGKLVKAWLENHVCSKTTPADVSIRGKDDILRQLYHVLKKLVELDVLIRGNDVRLLQPFHAPCKVVALDVLINGNDVSELHPNQAPAKLVPLEVSIEGNDVSPVQLLQVLLKLVPLDTSSVGNDVRLGRDEKAV